MLIFNNNYYNQVSIFQTGLSYRTYTQVPNFLELKIRAGGEGEREYLNLGFDGVKPFGSVRSFDGFALFNRSILGFLLSFELKFRSLFPLSLLSFELLPRRSKLEVHLLTIRNLKVGLVETQNQEK